MLGPGPEAHLIAQDDFEFFLGEDFWPWMILALGAAMVVGNVLALLRPPPAGRDDRGAKGSATDGRAERPPLGRSLVLIALGLAAGAWGLASLLA